MNRFIPRALLLVACASSLTLSLCSVAGPAGVAASPPTGLVAAYGFENGNGGVITDSSGNGNAGEIQGTIRTTTGRFGSALAFDGAGTFVTVPHSASLALTVGMTLEAWVFPTVLGGWRDVIYKADDAFYLEVSSDNQALPAMGGTFGGSPLYGRRALPINAWTHLAATYDGAMMRLFVNGVQVASQPETRSIYGSQEPLTIGGDEGYGQYFQGLIDEVRVYRVALTAAQIQEDMVTPILPVPSAPHHLSAKASSSTRVDLNWAASTGRLAVVEYRVERCEGAGCLAFTQVGTTGQTVFSDTAVSANRPYRYQVRAVDAGGNRSPYSEVAETYTGLSILPRVATVTFRRSQQFMVTGGREVIWSVDGVVGGSVAAGTITSRGLYSPPNTVGTHTVRATAYAPSESVEAIVYVTGYAGMFTHHNDNSRTGRNLEETVLTPANVNSATFGKLFSYPLDGVAYGSPLYVADVPLPGRGLRNVVYVVTEHDTVYAFDADGFSRQPLWQVSFIDPAAGVTTVPPEDTGEVYDITIEIGITSTPVIDRATRTLYVVAKTKETAGPSTEYIHRLHALDLATGAEKFGGPVVLQASVPGNGIGSEDGQVPFNSLRQLQRAALLLVNGVVYIAFASHGDNQPYHGWVLGYDANTLQQVMAYNVTPDGEGGGIWQSGGGLAADSAGNLYFVTGDGTFDANRGGVNYGDSFVKLSPNGTVLDYFTPHDEAILDSENRDLGSGGLLLLPDQTGASPHLITSAGKNRVLYLIDRDNFGHFNPVDDTQIVQSIQLPQLNFSTPVYFNQHVYYSLMSQPIKAYALNNGLFSSLPSSQSQDTFPFPGGALAISANGAQDGILWCVGRELTPTPGALYAYEAGNLGNKLYDSAQAGSRDELDVATKFSVPTVANGKVFVGSEGRLTVYGLLGNAPIPNEPRLTVTRDPDTGALTISWPQPAEGWVLEEGSAVGGASAWTRVSAAYQSNDTDVFVQVPAPAASRFYRLSLP